MKWFTAKAADKVAKITIDRAIGSDWAPDWIKDFTGELAARDLINEIEAMGELDTIQLEISSPGGDVASGIRIFNYLKSHQAKVEVTVTGRACSIASVIMLAGDSRVMATGAQVMIHRASGLVCDFINAEEAEEIAKNLRKADASIAAIYTEVTGKSADEIESLLNQGDYTMDADEAIKQGFATAKDKTLKMVASADLGAYRQQLAMQSQINKAETENQQLKSQIEELKKQQPIEATLASIHINSEWLTENHPDVVSGIFEAAEAEAIATERARVTSIIQACEAASQPQLVAKLISNGTPEDQAKEYVFDIAAASSSNIHGQHSPDGGNQTPVIDYGKIYSRLNKSTNPQ